MANVIEEITVDEIIPFRIHKVLIPAAGLIKDINNVSFPGLIIFPNELFQCLV
jgi:hypothetical protein